MKRLAILLCLLSTTSVAATGTGRSTATIESASSISNISDLYFGDILSSAIAGTVTVSYNGVRSSTGGATPLGSFSVAEFQVTNSGTSGSFVFSIDSSVTLTSGEESMVVELSIPTYFGQYCDHIGSNSSKNVKVGGALNVAAGQRPGNYSGTFNVIVSFFSGTCIL